LLQERTKMSPILLQLSLCVLVSSQQFTLHVNNCGSKCTPQPVLDGLVTDVSQSCNRTEQVLSELATSVSQLQAGMTQLQTANDQLQTSSAELQTAVSQLQMANAQLQSDVSDLKAANPNIPSKSKIRIQSRNTKKAVE